MRTGRPIIKRNAKTLARDIAGLKRVRRAILIDDSLDTRRVQAAVAAIDAALAALRSLTPTIRCDGI